MSTNNSATSATSAIDTALRRAITDSDRTLYELGAAAGVSRQVLTRFVSGERGMTLESAAKVARALGLVLVPQIGPRAGKK